MAVRIEVGYRHDVPDPRGLAVAGTVGSVLGIKARRVRSFDVYTVDAGLTADEAIRVCREFTDAVVQVSALDRLEPEPFDYVVEVGFRPGVTDAVGKSALVAVRDMLGRKLGVRDAVYTSKLYFFEGVSKEQTDAIATGVLANTLIERFEVYSAEQWLASEPDRSVPAVTSTHQPLAIEIDLSGTDDDLMNLSASRLLYLTLEEMKQIRSYFERTDVRWAREAIGLGRWPTDVELECLAQTWSEHCKHKIFNAQIEYREGSGTPITIKSPFKSHIRDATKAIADEQAAQGKHRLVSVFHDNAGVIAFNDRFHLVYKVETHNSPSALDPYGGAMTGIVGVNRDPYGTGLGCDLLVNVWGYCMADPRYAKPIPKGLMHPRRIRDGVHKGVIDGGNQSGIPYGRGWELFDDRYLGKPLVYCGTVGRMPVTTTGRRSECKAVKPGHRVVMCGGRIGKDGIHGATFSSAELDDSSPVQAVQIGDPITQKCMFDFLAEARDKGLYAAITDNGAGGLSSSVGELCTLSGGARIDLGKAPLKYSGLDPWEVLISEAQERMTLAVPAGQLQEFLRLANLREVEAVDLGEYTDSGNLEVLWNGKVVACLSLEFLHEGLPAMKLSAVWNPPKNSEPQIPALDDWTATLTRLLARANIASNELKSRMYDHEVKGLSVIKPFVGKQCDVPSDATVFLVDHGSVEGFVLSEGISPSFSDIDTRWMTAAVIDEAVRKAVGAGARLDWLAGLDNYCWPDPVLSDKTPDGEYKLAQLVRSTMALSEFCRAYGVPCISGKDSMKNDSTMGGVKISIPPTLLFSVIGRIDDVRKALTLDAKTLGAQVYLVGRTCDELGGSEFARSLGGGIGNCVPKLDPAETLPIYRAMQQAISSQIVDSCHSPAKGGLAVGLAKMAMASENGITVDLDRDPSCKGLCTASCLFSESNGRYVVTVLPEQTAQFEKVMAGLAVVRIGEVTEQAILQVSHGGKVSVRADVHALKRAWKETFDGI